MNSGLFTVMWGLTATAFGWIVATDFRDAARRLELMSRRSLPFGLGRQPVPVIAGVPVLRLVAGVFGLVGPVVLVVGLVELAGPDSAVTSAMPRPPLPFLLFATVPVALGLWMMWRPSGPLRGEWAGGGVVRRAAVVVLTLSVLCGLFAFVFDAMTVLPLCWLSAAVSGLILLPGRR
ncbi:hypothetical protein ACWD33_20080 [Streptomyces xiamenensis]|uniref:hypothetical protein n=1 Tax=Streptomyces TaxID=1883 RepID=UPI00069338D4|nr:hypothetical protein [Streptomyces sp. NRRL F-2890]